MLSASDEKPAAGVQEALARLRELVGEQHVLSGPEALDRYCRDTSQWLRRSAGIVFPATTEEVAGALRIAAASGLPVWVFSKGKNWGYGATMGFRAGALILILERMNRIHHVDAELAYAVIEPGVTQGQLNDYLKSQGIPLWADCTDSTPQGSVLGNALERGVGYTPYWDHFANLCGLEVVLPQGDVVRTGAGPANSTTWHTHKWGTGPFLEGLFSQSNFGIVTRAGVWLMPTPESFCCFVCELEEEQFPAAMDAIRRLALHRALPANVHFVNDIMLLAQLGPYPYDQLAGQTYLSEQARALLRRRFAISPWTVNGGLYGTAAQVRASRRSIKRELGRLGRLTFLGDFKFGLLGGLLRLWRKVAGVPLLPALLRFITQSSPEKLELVTHVYPILKGVPGEDIVGFAYFKSRTKRPKTDVDPARDGAGLIWLAVVVPLTGKHTRRLLELCQPVFHKHGFDLSIAFIQVNPRSVLGLIEVFFDKQNADESSRALALYNEAAAATRDAGYPQYRTSVAYNDRILEAAPGWQRLLNAMKAAVDPDNILAPGRYGIGLPKELDATESTIR